MLQVLAEPIQTVMRRYAVPEPYEKLKEFTRGQRVTKESMQAFVKGLEADMPPEAIAEMMEFTPMNYIGNAVAQCRALQAEMKAVQKTL